MDQIVANSDSFTWKRLIFLSVFALASIVTISAITKGIQRQQKNRKKKRDFIPLLPAGKSIRLLQNYDEAEEAAQFLQSKLENSKYPVLGFDIEWKPHSKGKKNMAALIQLSNGNECFLFHIIHFETNKVIPPTLRSLLQDSNILKVGVGANQDAKILFGDYGIETRGTVELSSLAIKHQQLSSGTSLSSLAQTLLEIEMVKSMHIRCSNWESKVLSPQQLDYAAADAWIAYKLFEKIYESKSLGIVLNSSDEEEISETQKVLAFCQDFIGRKPLHSKSKTPQKNSSNKEQKPKKEFSSRKEDLYDNCVMKSPDGSTMCTVNRKKLKWYLDRDLADLVSEDPPTIVLRFDPEGKGHHGDAYYLGKKENRCVVCGEHQNLVRHSVVPHSYRSQFDEIFKSRSSHDIVLLCQRCMMICGVNDGSHRMRIAERTGIPLDGTGPKEIVDETLKSVRSRAKLVKNATSKVPIERLNQSKEIIANYLNKSLEELKEEDIDQILSIPYKKPNPNHVSHDKLVVDRFVASNELQAFVVDWRKHFISSMQPKFLPEHWDVNRPLSEREFNPHS